MSAKTKKPKREPEPFLTTDRQSETAAHCVMGIDASLTSTGWCFLSEGRTVFASFGSKFTGPERLRDLYDQLCGVMDIVKPTMVVLEGYSYGSSFNREALAELGGLIRLALWDRKIPTLIVAPTTLKKFVLNGQTTDKDQMLLASYKRWGIEFANNDECDAHALAQLGLVRLSLEPQTSPSKSFDRCKAPQRMKEAAMTAAILIRPTASPSPNKAEPGKPTRRRTPATA